MPGNNDARLIDEDRVGKSKLAAVLLTKAIRTGKSRLAQRTRTSNQTVMSGRIELRAQNEGLVG